MSSLDNKIVLQAGVAEAISSVSGGTPSQSSSLQALRSEWMEASTSLGDPTIALKVPASLKRGTFGLFEYIVRNAPTLEMYLRCSKFGSSSGSL